MKYLVNIEEILTRDIVVEAESEDDAEIIVKNLYRDEKIVLDYTDFIGKPTIKCKRKCIESEGSTKFD